MLLSELKLTNLGHCHVHLPTIFTSKEPNLKVGSTISIKSVQNDTELFAMWNGQLSSGDYAQLDLTFGQANSFKDETIVLSLAKDLDLKDCSMCRVELVEASDYSILSQHLNANVLDHCRLVSKGLIIPIWLSQNVKVPVKVMAIEPNSDCGLLTRETEFQYQHSLENIPPTSSNTNEQADTDAKVLEPIKDPIPFVSCSLGIDYRPQLNLGAMLVCGDQGSGKTHYLKTVLHNYDRFKSELYDCNQFRGKRVETVKKILNELLAKAQANQPFILALDDIDSFLASDLKHDDEKGQEVIYRKRLVDLFCNTLEELEQKPEAINILVIATSRSLDCLDARLSKPEGRKYFSEIVKLKEPTVGDRATILRSVISEYKNMESEVDDKQLVAVAKRCASFMPADLRRVIERSIISACSRSMVEFNCDLLKLTESDLANALDGYTPANLRGVSLQPKTLRTFEQVGGLKKVKEILRKTILLQVKYPKLFKKSPLKIQSSILLHGPPGCGKTLVAEALSNEDSLNSICVRGPELLSKYIGASEGAVRDLFRRAQLARPCLIFFDEFESLVSKRGADSTGVTDRVVNQFLTLMDGVEHLSDGVFILAASSRPDMIDPAILRPGRMDKHVYCGPPDEEDRREILEIMARNIEFVGGQRGELLADLAAKLEGFTGADCQSLLYSAQMKALHEAIAARTDGGGDNGDLVVRLSGSHLDTAYDEMKAEVAHRYTDLMRKYPPTIRSTQPQAASVRATLA